MRLRKVNKTVGLILSLLMINNIVPVFIPERVIVNMEKTIERRKE